MPAELRGSGAASEGSGAGSEESGDAFQERVGVAPSAATVQDLGYRWEACGKGERPPLAQCPAAAVVIDYIVVHELVHLLEPHHTPAFWTRVERAMRDYEQRKRLLAELGREASQSCP